MNITKNTSVIVTDIPQKDPFDDLLPADDDRSSSERSYPVLISQQFGHPKITMILSMQYLMDLSAVANTRTIKERPGLFEDIEPTEEGEVLPDPRQRDLTVSHAKDLAYFEMQGCFHAIERRFRRRGIAIPEVFEQMYKRVGAVTFAELIPFVANIRGTPRIDKENMQIWLSAANILWIVDGQHRLVGCKMLSDYLTEVLQTRKYKKNGLYPPKDHDEVTSEEIRVWEMVLEEFRRSEVTLQVNLNLNVAEEKSSFHYLNNFQKPVNPELALSFDESNPINAFSAELMRRDDVAGKQIGKESLVAINSLLFTRKTGMKGARPADIYDKKAYAYKFWERVLEIPGVLEKSSAAQPVVIKALASIAYALLKAGDLVNLNTLFAEIPGFDFSHTNPLWRYYTMSEADREKHQLTDLATYLPPDDDGTKIRALGIYKPDSKGKGGHMHWSITHNEVYPLLADMIRWKLELPPRKHQKRVKKVKVEGLL